MTDQLAVTGLIATTPRHIVTSEGLAITSFRLASHQRWFDRKVGRWSDGAMERWGDQLVHRHRIS